MSDGPGRHLWVALLHHPVLDRQGRSVSTSVTNLDVHDLARSSRTYGLAGLCIVTPIEAQLSIVERIVGYWNEPRHAARTPGRPESLALVHALRDVGQARRMVRGEEGRDPVLIGTTAHGGEGRLPFSTLRSQMELDPETARMILLGTGWGLTGETLDACDHVLEPIGGPTSYNHLSVRSACAVMLDRLLGSQR